MAGTGVLPFVRGIDLSGNDFSGGLFPKCVREMAVLRWLKLNHTNLDKLPEELSSLKNLEHLQMTHNALSSVHGELSDLPCLRSVVVRNNQIKTSGIPTDIFDMQDLNIIDFNRNALKETPPNLDHATGAIVLNLSHNNLESIPNQVLILSDNPLFHFQLKQLPCMSHLRVLRMRKTQRSSANMPTTFENLLSLEEVDFSCNELTEIPEAMYKLENLKRLNISDNCIEKFEPFAECWPKLEVLNLSRNKLTALPDLLTRMQNLKKLYVNENQLTFDGVPTGIGKLINLEIFQAAHNRLELVPEGVCRCVKLRRLKLNNNRLVTMPSSVYFLVDLVELDVRNNVDLVMPPRPKERLKERLAFYNIDFSLEHQMHLAEASSSSSVGSGHTSVTKDPVSRKIQYLRRRRGQTEADTEQRKILRGMTDCASGRLADEQASVDQAEQQCKSKRWDEALEKPAIDYSELFDPDVGQLPGVTVFEIENFLPNQLEDVFHGKFYEGDCYIVLRTTLDASGNLEWQIYYWIGEHATVDKMACAAIHAVNLRNFLGANCRTIREEMNDESDEFLDIFNQDIIYVEGGRTPSGFFTIEQVHRPPRLYRVSTVAKRLNFYSVPLSWNSLDPRFVFLLDTVEKLTVWLVVGTENFHIYLAANTSNNKHNRYGERSKMVLRTKARLFAEKMNKTERKGVAEIEIFKQNAEPDDFLDLLDCKHDGPREPIVQHVPDNFQLPKAILYKVCLGMGYLELPQVKIPRLGLKQEMLESRCVYILDCYVDLFLWIGKKSTRLVRAAGSKLTAELHAMLNRPSHSSINHVCEGTESMMFKSKFVDWDDVIAVDFTRTAESVQRRGVDLNIILEKDKMKTDLAALFLDRQAMLSDEESDRLIEDYNEGWLLSCLLDVGVCIILLCDPFADVELMEPFVLEGKRFNRLPPEEFGIFYSSDCYVFLCRYSVPPEGIDEVQSGEIQAEEAKVAGDGEEEADGNGSSETGAEADFQCVVYFWQGRDASNMGWLMFTFSLLPKFKSLFKDKVDVVRTNQQQENQKFLSHFKKRFVIRQGRRNLCLFPGFQNWPRLYQLRANGGAINSRTVQIDCDSSLLNSEFCSALTVPFNVPDENGHRGCIFLWIGSRALASQVELLSDVVDRRLNPAKWPVERVREGEEPELFWNSIGGRKPYEHNANFMRYSRLFRCTNEKGYFVVSEKTIDFCQDDLDDDDVMILDNGDQIIMWVGSNASEVEVKLAFKAMQVYFQHLRLKQPDRPRKLAATVKGKEPKNFKKCFHAWAKHKHPAGEV
ncbi:Protein flightless-1 -like protein [Trichinella murrelli]|uniref:Protein flightless-1-like protein n=2 Tax=Trichinella murrelli TaxID=144512 RepID=A0A0V0TWC8_9BILA|nr:Protein flightless-1 -like protein [Trichinella murrelli]